MKPFYSIEQALEFVADKLIPAQHNYIVNILEPAEVEAREEGTPQITSHHMEFHDGDSGLTVALPFASGSEEYTRMAAALALDSQRDLTEGELDGARRSFLNLHANVPLATQVVNYLLQQVYGYPPAAQFVCVVHDEGPIRPRQEAP
jgi:hypothetical protein